MPMNRRQIVKSALAAFGGMTLARAGIATAAPSGYGIVGRYAPELQVGYWIDGDGKDTEAFKLADHAGKWVLLKCFQSWCPGCHSHGLPAVKTMFDELGDNPNIAFAGIQTVFEGHYTNTVDKVRKIQLQYDLQIPMGHDPGIEHGRPLTMVDYRTGGTPWIILIDPERRVIFNEFGIDAGKAIDFLQKQTA